MALNFFWPVGRIKEALSEKGSHAPSSPKSCSAETINILAALVEEQNIIPEANITLGAGVTAFLWLYTCIQGCVSNSCLMFSRYNLALQLTKFFI